MRNNDNFYDYFRDALKDHQDDVDEKCWENISKRMEPKRTRLLWPLISTAAAAAIALFILLPYATKDSDKTQQPVISQKIAVENPKSDEKRITAYNIPDTKNMKVISKRPTITEESAITEEKSITEKKAMPEEQAQPEANRAAVKPAKRDYTGSDKAYDFAVDNHPTKRENRWTVSASIGALGKTTGSTPNNYSAVRTLQPLQSFEIASSTISDAEYAAPFSVGLSVRKEFSKTFSVETGLVYSYLSTTYRNGGNQQYKAKLKLHYIGVPVNLVANLWSISNDCMLYASSGMMVEKGVKSDFSQYLSETKQSITSNQSIKGVQWSANASLGISYRIFRNWNIYLEPHLSYYFDNNQPVSIRTQKHTIVGFNSGFRLEL